MGDVGAVMPALHPTISGASGDDHGVDYYITDPECACVKSAQVQLIALKLLLENGGQRAKEIVANYQPEFDSMQEYFDFVDKLNLDVDAVTYEDGKAVLRYGG